MSLKPTITALSALFSFTAISISVYFNINPAYKTFTLESGQTKVIDQNIGLGTISYNIDIESRFEVKDKGVFSVFEGTELRLVYLGDTIEKHFTSYDKDETFSVDIPENAKLIVCCSKNMTGKAKCIIRERKTFPQKNYSFDPNYDDTTKVFIQPEKENLIYDNNTASVVLLRVFVSNHFKDNLKEEAILPFSDEVILYVKKPNEDDKVLKPLKQRSYVQTGQSKTFPYILQPGYSLNIKSSGKKLTGYCYFQKKALAF